MRCPKCGHRTNVIDSRSSETTGSRHKRNAGVFRPAKDAVSWYTWDFVARRRVCRDCGWSGHTVEITIDDILDMLAEAKNGNYKYKRSSED